MNENGWNGGGGAVGGGAPPNERPTAISTASASSLSTVRMFCTSDPARMPNQLIPVRNTIVPTAHGAGLAIFTPSAAPRYSTNTVDTAAIAPEWLTMSRFQP